MKKEKEIIKIRSDIGVEKDIEGVFMANLKVANLIKRGIRNIVIQVCNEGQGIDEDQTKTALDLLVKRNGLPVVSE